MHAISRKKSPESIDLDKKKVSVFQYERKQVALADCAQLAMSSQYAR